MVPSMLADVGRGAWNFEPTGMAQRAKLALSDGVREIALFAFVPADVHASCMQSWLPVARAFINGTI